MSFSVSECGFPAGSITLKAGTSGISVNTIDIRLGKRSLSRTIFCSTFTSIQQARHYHLHRT